MYLENRGQLASAKEVIPADSTLFNCENTDLSLIYGKT